jgi:hypothetical protein
MFDSGQHSGFIFAKCLLNDFVHSFHKKTVTLIEFGNKFSRKIILNIFNYKSKKNLIYFLSHNF